MEYIYSAMLLHAAKKEITEDAVTGVLKGAGLEPDSAKVKALVASLKDVDIEEAMSKAVAMPAAAPAAGAAPAEAAEKKEEKKEDEGKTEEEAAEGLGALFG